MRTSRGHRTEAYGCEYWAGDRDPVYWGTCPVCEPGQATALDPEGAAAERLIRLDDEPELSSWTTPRIALVALFVVLAAYGLLHIFVELLAWAESIDLVQSS